MVVTHFVFAANQNIAVLPKPLIQSAGDNNKQFTFSSSSRFPTLHFLVSLPLGSSLQHFSTLLLFCLPFSSVFLPSPSPSPITSPDVSFPFPVPSPLPSSRAHEENPLWNNHHVSMWVKSMIYRAIVLSTLLQGAEA